MIVILEDGLFAAPGINPLLLLSIFRHGLEGRHLVMMDPSLRPRKYPLLERWLEKHDPLVVDAVKGALARGFNATSGAKSKVLVRVGAKPQSYWENAPPLLTPDDAALFMEFPLHLVLEDRLTDKHFLLCVMPTPTREAFQKACKKGWCRVENGGGLGNMCRLVESLKGEDAERLRTWLLFDRDTAPSGAPSEQSQELKEACATHALPHHQLWRRSIENYLPLPALHQCPQRFHGKPRQEWTRLVEDLERLPAELRHRLNLKQHFRHRDIAKLFQGEHVEIKREWLEQDNQKDELEAITRAIFERM